MYKWTNGTDYLAHHGIKGQKWGVRRFQNEDGTLTPAGKARLDRYKEREELTAAKGYNKQLNRVNRQLGRLSTKKESIKFKGGDASKVSDKINSAKDRKKNIEEMMDKELKAIRSMSYSDMINEKKEVARAGRNAALASIATIVALGALGSPMASMYTPDYAAIKRRMRTDD